MSAPFVVDETFKRKISYLKVTELHLLLRNLGVSYQANKEQLVKRVIVKYSQIYEQYMKGLVPYEDAKTYGDWINNDNNIVYMPSTPQVSPPKVQSPPSNSTTRTKPVIINVPHSQSSYGGDLSSYQSASTNHYSNNNNYYNYNMYASTQTNSGANGYFSTSSTNNLVPKPTTSHAPVSGSTKATSIDILYNKPQELVFPKSVDPFLEIEATLTSTRLKSYAESRGRPSSINFLVPESYLSSIRAGTSRAVVRSFEVSNNMAHVSLPHAWPPDCTLSVNGTYMALGIKKQIKPNAPPHPDKPLDISKECRSGRNTMEVTTSTSRHYAVVIDIMRVISVDTLVDIVMKNKTMNFDGAKKTISLALGGDDKDIAALHTTVSLHCPLGRTPLILPAKSSSCRHIQCFDLRNYLMMNQRTPSWKCPVCSTVANTTNLVIDAYFTELLRNVDSSTVSEVHIDPSGSWSTTKPRKSIIPKPEPASPIIRSFSVSSSPVTPSPQKPKRPVEIIDLLSDDDDDGDDVIQLPPKRAKSDTPKPSAPPSVNNPVIVSSAPPSPSLESSPFPSTASNVEATTTSAFSYPGTSSSPSTPLPALSPALSAPNSPIPRMQPYSSSPPLTLPSITTIQPNVPTLPSLPSIISHSQPPSTSEDTNFEPNLQSDLFSLALPPLATSDTPPESRKKNSIIVKLRLGQRPPPPSSSSTSPPPSVPSESSDSLSSLEFPSLADSFSSSGDSTGRYPTNHHHYCPSSPPDEYGHHWPHHQNYSPSSHPHYHETYNHEQLHYYHDHEQSYDHHEPYGSDDEPQHDHHDCNLHSDHQGYNEYHYPDNHTDHDHDYHDHTDHDQHDHDYHDHHDYQDYHDHHDYHNPPPPPPPPPRYDDYDYDYYSYMHNRGTYYNNSHSPTNNRPTNHHSPTHRNGYLDIDEDENNNKNNNNNYNNNYNNNNNNNNQYTDINTFPPTVTHPNLPLSHPLPSPSHPLQHSSPGTYTTSTTTTTTTTSSIHHTSGSLSQPVVVVSDDE